MRILRNIITAATLALAPQTGTAEDAAAIALALSAADAGDWAIAQAAAARSGPMAQALLDWQALRAGRGEFADYLAFLRAHPDWPGLALLRERGDATLRPDLPPADIRDWLGTRQPDTLVAETALLATLPADQAQAERTRFWTHAPLNAGDEAAFLADYAAEMAPYHTARVTNLLDAQDWAAAERSLPLLDQATRALPAARIALQARREGVDDLINALPPDQHADPGLTMDRFRWRVRAKLHDLARDLMLESSTSAEALRRPEIWAQMRVDYARLAMRNGDWALAERLATAHFLPPDNRHTADLEWLAGFAALKQGAADRALGHFAQLETIVGSAISLSRAGYWQGRALEAAGNAPAARAAYLKAAAHPATYYGQLAAQRTGTPMPAAFAVQGRAEDSLPDWRGSDLLRDSQVFRAGLWLVAAHRPDEAQRFFLHLAETAAPDDIARMARLMLEIRAPWHALRLSKMAARKGVVYPATHFPLTGLEARDFGKLPTELVLAIARQESEFNHRVTSHAGAKGLMQLMPGTAQQMARQLDMPYQSGRLTTDPDYNATLGSGYLAGLRDRFGASVALIASGYNAGPGRPARWLDQFGDLRRHADPVDWVELIPFDETRNYVMRVAEALPIYRARMAGKPAPVVPIWDLTGGGLMPPPPLRLTLARSKPPPAKPFIGPQLPPGWTNPLANLPAAPQR